jgi:hypothetical protein
MPGRWAAREMPSDREQAIQAFHLLNGFLGDLISACNVRQRYLRAAEQGSIQQEQFTIVNRMCLSQMFLVLTKWVEFHARFSAIIPSDIAKPCRMLTREVRRRRVLEFRNKVLGHIWDKARGRPLTNPEIDAMVDSIVARDQQAFVDWCASRTGEFPNSVASIIDKLMARLQEKFGLTKRDLFG